MLPLLLYDSFPFEEPTLCFRPFVTVVAGSPGSLMALGIATGKKEEVVTLIFSGNVNKGQRIRVGVDAEALALHDFQTLVFLKFFLMAFPSCPSERGLSTLADRTNDIWDEFKTVQPLTPVCHPVRDTVSEAGVKTGD